MTGRNWTRKSNPAYTARVATTAPTPERRLTARGAATKARIVAAAASLVYERGFAGTSLDEVMAATGTSKSQLYHYFADKDALIHEVIKAQLGRIFTAQQAAGLHEVSSWDGLQRWCDHFLTTTRDTQGAGGCPLGSLVGELADQSEPARRVLAQCFAEWQSYLSDGLDTMRDHGELAAQADPAELALTLLSAPVGCLAAIVWQAAKQRCHVAAGTELLERDRVPPRAGGQRADR